MENADRRRAVGEAMIHAPVTVVPPIRMPWKWRLAEIAAEAAWGRIDLPPEYTKACDRLREEFAIYHRCASRGDRITLRSQEPIIENLIEWQRESAMRARAVKP